MYKVRYDLTATLVPTNQQPPLTPQTFTNPTQMQQPMDSSWSHTTSWYEDYYGGPPFYTGPVHPGMAPNRQLQYPGPVYQGIATNRQVQYPAPVYQGMAPNQQLHNQYRPPRSGPSRNRRRNGPRKTEHPYENHMKHESSGAVPHDRSTGVNPGMARNDATNNTRRGEQKRPYSRPYSGPHRAGRVYAVKSTASSSTPTPALLVSASASAPPSDPPISEEQVEEDDLDAISLGSDTELGG